MTLDGRRKNARTQAADHDVLEPAAQALLQYVRKTHTCLRDSCLEEPYGAN